MLFGKVDLLHLVEEPPSAEDAADQLADDGRDGRTLHAHLKRHDEQPVQPNVQEAGHQQEIERVLRIAQTAQDRGRIVIQHRGRDAEENHADIPHRIIQQFRRSMDEPKQRSRDQGRHDRKHDAHGHAKHRTIEQIFVQVLAVLCAKALCDRDAEAVAGRQHETDDHEVERIGRADCAQSVCANAAAHDDRIHKTIQLLEQRSQHQRQRELQNAGQRTANGQVGRTGTLFLCFLHRNDSSKIFSSV